LFSIAIGQRDRCPASPCEAWGHAGVFERGRHAPAHRHPPGETVDPPGELARRTQTTGPRQRQRIRDPHDAVDGCERRLEDVGIRQIPSLDIRRNSGMEGEATPTIGIQDSREHARRIEGGQTEPVDRTVPRNQREGATFPDRA
jgi:hypothetical protein